jgi:hypothetical protein
MVGILFCLAAVAFLTGSAALGESRLTPRRRTANN